MSTPDRAAANDRTQDADPHAGMRADAMPQSGADALPEKAGASDSTQDADPHAGKRADAMPRTDDATAKKSFWKKQLEAGRPLPIIAAAALAIAIGLAVSTTGGAPRPAWIILAIPGNLWLRALRATGK
jgi:hypothetical protein